MSVMNEQNSNGTAQPVRRFNGPHRPLLTAGGAFRLAPGLQLSQELEQEPAAPRQPNHAERRAAEAQARHDKNKKKAPEPVIETAEVVEPVHPIPHISVGAGLIEVAAKAMAEAKASLAVKEEAALVIALEAHEETHAERAKAEKEKVIKAALLYKLEREQTGRSLDAALASVKAELAAAERQALPAETAAADKPKVWAARTAWLKEVQAKRPQIIPTGGDNNSEKAPAATAGQKEEEITMSKIATVTSIDRGTEEAEEAEVVVEVKPKAAEKEKLTKEQWEARQQFGEVHKRLHAIDKRLQHGVANSAIAIAYGAGGAVLGTAITGGVKWLWRKAFGGSAVTLPPA